MKLEEFDRLLVGTVARLTITKLRKEGISPEHVLEHPELVTNLLSEIDDLTVPQRLVLSKGDFIHLVFETVMELARQSIAHSQLRVN